jgi:hypothetical protein
MDRNRRNALMAMLGKSAKGGIILLSIGLVGLAAYAAAGVYLAPHLLRTQVLPGVSERIGARLAAERVEIDPFRLRLDIHGLSVQDPAGGQLAAFRELSVDVAGWESMARRRLTLSARIAESALRLEVNAKGELNFPLRAPGGKNAGGTFPFLLTRFAVERSRIELTDASRSRPYAKALEDVALNLENFGNEAHVRTAFTVTAKSRGGEALSAAGTFTRSPLVVEGRLQASEVDLVPLTHYLAPDSPWRIRSGKAAAKADFRLRVEDKPVLEIRADEGAVQGLELVDSRADTPRLQIQSLSVGDLSYSRREQRLTLGSVLLRGVTTPWAQAGSLSVEGLSYALAEHDVVLDSATAEDVTAAAEVLAQADRLGRKNVRLAGRGEADTGEDRPRVARIGSLKVFGIDGSPKKRTVAIDALISQRAELDITRLPGGIVQLRGFPAVKLGAGEPDSPWASWRLRIAEIRLNGYSVKFRDETVQPPARLDFDSAALRLTDLSTEPGSQFKFRLDTRVQDHGKIEVDGQARLDPLAVDLRFGVDRFALRSLQPYWRDRTGVDLVRGRLNLWGDITVRRDPDPRVDYSGGADIVNLATVDRAEGKPFIGWNSLKFDGLVIHSRPKRFAVRTVTAEQPYARVLVAADGSLNLAKELSKGAAKPDGPRAAARPAEPWPLVAGLVRVLDGRMDFADLSWKPGFASEIRHLRGTIGGLSSNRNARANVLLEGRMDQDCPVRIAGQINPFQWANHTDVTMEFQGVNMTTLSPYASKFAGYRIEKGKLDMNLRYKVQDRRLEVENRAVLDQLVLGERVESPGATTLPVDLAVALLKDADGRIDIDLPVSGNLDDPEFSLGNLYANALTQMVSKLVSSPLTLLSTLVKGGDEELGYVSFRPGDVSLTDREKTKLGKLAGALKERPELNLDIKGAADPRRDRLALAEQALLGQLKNAWRIESVAPSQRASGARRRDLADADYRRLFTQFYRQRHPDAPELQSLAIEKTPVLQGALFDRAKRQVLEQWAVNELDLRRLAQARGESIRDYLIQEGGLPAKRIYLRDVKLDPREDREIKAFLSLSGSYLWARPDLPGKE